MNDAAKVLGVLWGTGHHSLCYKLPDRPFAVQGFYDTPDALWAATVERANAGADTYFGVNALARVPTSGRGRSSDVLWVVALYVDLDWADEAHKGTELPSEDELRGALAEFEHQPSIVVHSGHGLQAYWPLTYPIEASMGLDLQHGLHGALEAAGMKPERFDLASVLRLPGSINYKSDPVVVRLETFRSRRFVPTMLVRPKPNHLEDSLRTQGKSSRDDDRIPMPSTPRPDSTDDGMTPIEWFIENTDFVDELVRRGWQYHSEDRFEGDLTSMWTRPGKDTRDGHSARLLRSGVLIVWTSAVPGLPPGRYDVAEFVAALDHGGRKDDLASHVRRNLMPKPPPAPLYAPQGAADGPEPPVGPVMWPRLPEAFWSATDEFAHIARAADAATAGREAVLLCSIVLVLLHAPNVVTLAPPPRKAALNAFACLVGYPADGKGTAMDTALAVMPPPPGTFHTTLGTAEGFVKAFHQRDPDHSGKGVAPLVRHWNPILVRTDEIGAFVATAGSAGERGAALLAELKSAFSGERLGKGYATEDKGMQIAPWTYRACGLLAIAPEKAEPLMGDLGGGWPERLLYAPAAPTHIPEYGEAIPDDPGPLPWSNPWDGYRYGVTPTFGRDERVAKAAHDLNRAYRMRLTTVDPHDVHAVLIRLKVAAGLAMLAGRRSMQWSDWEHAEQVMAVSRATRSHLLAIIDDGKRRLQQAKDARVLNLDVARGHAQHHHKVIEVAKRLAKMARDEPGITRKQARGRLSRNSRDVLEDALEHAKGSGWLIEADIEVNGGVTRVLQPGNVQV